MVSAPVVVTMIEVALVVLVVSVVLVLLVVLMVLVVLLVLVVLPWCCHVVGVGVGLGGVGGVGGVGLVGPVGCPASVGGAGHCHWMVLVLVVAAFIANFHPASQVN